MQAVTIQADKGLDDVMTEWLVNLVRAMPVGPEGLKFNGNLHNGTIVNHRAAGVWTVSWCHRRRCQLAGQTSGRAAWPACAGVRAGQVAAGGVRVYRGAADRAW
jgi:hypothetical protein